MKILILGIIINLLSGRFLVSKWKLPPVEKPIARGEYNNIVSSTMKSIRLFLIAQELCRSFPYLMIQGCCPITDPLYIRPVHADRMKEVRRIQVTKSSQEEGRRIL